MIRFLFYLLIPILFIVAFLWKEKGIVQANQVEVTSIRSEWKKHGKPVDVIKVRKGDVVFYEVVSGHLRPGGLVEANVTKSLVSTVQSGKPFSVPVEGGILQGNVLRISDRPDLVTGLYTVILKLTNRLNVDVGTLVKANVESRRYESRLIIPVNAVTTDQGKDFCWVVMDNKAVKKPVKLGVKNDNVFEIRSGLKLGDHVVVDGAVNLIENDFVRIRKIKKGNEPS